MTIHPAPQDTIPAEEHTAYDSVWAGGNAATETTPAPPAGDLDRVFLSHEKIYVVLAVVLIIWFGIVLLLFRTDRRLRRVERSLEADSLERDKYNQTHA